ncbi:hypothetical protein K450DRAFT_262643 [Umbelopsis ramanniana AG]|uniref:Mediator of RNA polymerase II transcription subunit 4 n=1 Tax=Umbelopsis ramanniana AG TaxID=1314678 RepID=A0AAD5HA87_UMBRA|nr:uncharacterized protein K450DRAFT_262643 [Umbelopsis ramanniana AG]KAI8575251.1 hypothetical protein K450DRAFT_262643 [Umbelopsis ramanniana AG]
MTDVAESLSLKVQVGSLLSEYASLVRQYFTAVNSLIETPNLPIENTPDYITNRILAVDAKLQQAVKKIDEHQRQHQQIVAIQEDIKAQNASLLMVVNRLQETRSLLAETLSGAQEELTLMKKASDANMNFSDILSYASKLSKYTSAPPNFNMMKDMKVDFEKPYPDEERMRRGILYWQHVPPEQQAQETFDNSSSESSEDEEGQDDGMGKPAAGGEDIHNDAFWELDLNPDLPS